MAGLANHTVYEPFPNVIRERWRPCCLSRSLQGARRAGKSARIATLRTTQDMRTGFEILTVLPFLLHAATMNNRAVLVRSSMSSGTSESFRQLSQKAVPEPAQECSELFRALPLLARLGCGWTAQLCLQHSYGITQRSSINLWTRI